MLDSSLLEHLFVPPGATDMFLHNSIFDQSAPKRTQVANSKMALADVCGLKLESRFSLSTQLDELCSSQIGQSNVEEFEVPHNWDVSKTFLFKYILRSPFVKFVQPHFSNLALSSKPAFSPAFLVVADMPQPHIYMRMWSMNVATTLNDVCVCFQQCKSVTYEQ